MTDSTTMGLGVVYGGLVLREGQELLTTTHDHIVTHLALEYRAARTNNPLRKVALYDEPAPRASTRSPVGSPRRSRRRRASSP